MGERIMKRKSKNIKKNTAQQSEKKRIINLDRGGIVEKKWQEKSYTYIEVLWRSWAVASRATVNISIHGYAEP